MSFAAFNCTKCKEELTVTMIDHERHVIVVCSNCKQRMRVKVPRSPVPTVQTAIPAHMVPGITQRGDGRFDTGMKVEEAIMRATNWWENKGRRLMQLEHMRQSEPVGSSNKGMGTAFANYADAEDPNFMPSGIIAGEPWEQLDQRSQIFIVKAWHHFAIRRPDILGVASDDPYEFKANNKERILN